MNCLAIEHWLIKLEFFYTYSLAAYRGSTGFQAVIMMAFCRSPGTGKRCTATGLKTNSLFILCIVSRHSVSVVSD